MAQDNSPETHWRVMGAGPRAALALHCTMAHSGAWRGLSEALNDQLTLHAPDMPGHGRSADYDGISCTGSLLTEAILAHLDEPVDVIAHSFGGVVALHLAIAHPELVRSLTLYEPVFMALAMIVDADGFGAHDAMIEDIRANVVAGQNENAARMFVSDWGDGTDWAQLPDRAREGFARRIPFVIGSQNYVAFDTPGTLARLGEIGVPTLVMNGGQSPDVIAKLCRGLVEQIPDARHVTLPDAGHMGAITHAGELASHVLRQLDRAPIPS
ncbi:alpha/beta hydrolase [Shimia sp.]|uniref:alpha/beta fold hydrolase n=1 Tax=Shimia sp. TaxID=1954381 RepID=UPI003296B6CE